MQTTIENARSRRTARLSFTRLCLASLILAAVTTAHAGNNGHSWALSKRIIGNWYIALDAGAFNPAFEGTFLSGLAQFHSDKTFTIVDAGDYGAQSLFGTFASPQHGTWRFARDGSGRRIIRGTTLYLEARGNDGEVFAWNKVHFNLRVVDKNLVEGTINGLFLPCPEMPPFPTPLTCPDPVANADAFMPAGPPDAPLTMTRIVVGQ